MRRLVIALALVAVALAGCGKSSSSTSSGSPPVSLEGAVNNHGTKAAKASMEVELDDFYFAPTFIKATAGQKVTVEIKNEGKATHTFTSTDLNVDEELAPGATKTISLSAPSTGHALFFCRFHRGSGMQGSVYIG